MAVYPHKVQIGARWVDFEKLALHELIGFVQMQALDALMAGKPFASVIADTVQYTMWWTEKQK